MPWGDALGMIVRQGRARRRGGSAPDACASPPEYLGRDEGVVAKRPRGRYIGADDLKEPAMAATERPQIYLITPPEIDLAGFPDRLGAVLDAHEIACVRLALATRDEDRLGRAADAVREAAHARDVAIVIEAHVQLALRHGLDGVHLSDHARSVRAVRKELGGDAIVGAFCGTSRHDGMTAAEIGADYVSFGPVGTTTLGSGESAPLELFRWWSEMIEVPVVAEGHLDEDVVRTLSPVTDFFGIGEEIWGQEDAGAALGRLIAAMV